MKARQQLVRRLFQLVQMRDGNQSSGKGNTRVEKDMRNSMYVIRRNRDS